MHTAVVSFFSRVILRHLSSSCTDEPAYKREDVHQKTPPAYTEGVFHTTKDHAVSADTLESPSLSLAGQTAIVNQAVLLAPVHRAPAPSQGNFPPVTFSEMTSHFHAGLLTDTVAGPLRLTPDSLLSLMTPDSTI